VIDVIGGELEEYLYRRSSSSSSSSSNSLLDMANKPQPPHTIVHKIGKNKNKVISEIKLVHVFENHAHDIVTFG